MTRYLKALGLAMMAAFAFSAIAAAGASADEQGKLTSDGPVTLTGTEKGEAENRLTAFGGFVQCPGSTATGHRVMTFAQTEDVDHTEAGVGQGMIDVPATTVTITPHYKQANENCRGSSGSYATVDMNGCDYVSHLGDTTPAGNTEGTYGVTFDIVCPAGEEITVTFWFTESSHTNEPNNPRCVTHIPPQTGLTGAHATDSDVNDGKFTLSGTVTNITATQTRNSFLCPSGTHTSTASFHLNQEVTGHNKLGEPTDVSITDETHTGA